MAPWRRVGSGWLGLKRVICTFPRLATGLSCRTLSPIGYDFQQIKRLRKWLPGWSTGVADGSLTLGLRWGWSSLLQRRLSRFTLSPIEQQEAEARTEFVCRTLIWIEVDVTMPYGCFRIWNGAPPRPLCLLLMARGPMVRAISVKPYSSSSTTIILYLL